MRTCVGEWGLSRRRPRQAVSTRVCTGGHLGTTVWSQLCGDNPTAQLHQERLVPMPSRNRRPSAVLDISLGGGDWIGLLSTGRRRAGTLAAESPAVGWERAREGRSSAGPLFAMCSKRRTGRTGVVERGWACGAVCSCRDAVSGRRVAGSPSLVEWAEEAESACYGRAATGGAAAVPSRRVSKLRVEEGGDDCFFTLGAHAHAHACTHTRHTTRGRIGGRAR